jgi:uncharacterized Fe-S cluster-containing radical SAM superfamily protein
MGKLRDAANGMSCVACGKQDGTVVLAHYFGPRRHNYGGGMSRKGHDVVGAWLCSACHTYMDTSSKDKEHRWEHSEEMLHYCALTWIQLIEQGVLK